MWRFRKSFSPLPGVRLTLSPSGISTSVGVGPFRVTAGPKGSRFTARVPGTGISYQQTIGSSYSAISPVVIPEPEVVLPQAPKATQIQSAGSEILTTAGLTEFRSLLLSARAEKQEIERELSVARASEKQLVSQYEGWKNGFFLRRIRKNRFAELEFEAGEATAKRDELENQASLVKLDTKIEVPDVVKFAYSRLVDSFGRMAMSERIWDMVSHAAVNQVAERSVAHRAVERKPVKFDFEDCGLIESEWKVPHLENANGGDLYLYPLFVLYFAGGENFAVMEYSQIQFHPIATRFHEQEAVPRDSKIVGKTWAKTNKDGSPDRRFKGNYEIPVALYGDMVFKSSTGLNEEYLISNADAFIEFAKDWGSLVEAMSALRN